MNEGRKEISKEGKEGSQERKLVKEGRRDGIQGRKKESQESGKRRQGR